VKLGVNALDVIVDEVKLLNDSLDCAPVPMTARLNADQDAAAGAKGHELTEKLRLGQGLAAGKRHAAPGIAIEPDLVLKPAIQGLGRPVLTSYADRLDRADPGAVPGGTGATRIALESRIAVRSRSNGRTTTGPGASQTAQAATPAVPRLRVGL
jgi:hypothetical protein